MMVIPTTLGQPRSVLNIVSNMAQQSTGLGVAHPVPYAPANPETVDLRDSQDNTPSESQPPGVDDEPQSLEEALTG